jgi:hypothetical protein
MKKLPKSLAACVDLLYQTRQERLESQRIIEDLHNLETQLKDHIIDKLPKSDATGIAGKLARATIVVKAKPTVENWDEFYAHVKKTGQFDLLQRRLSESAVVERWEDKKAVPGVGKFNVVSVSVNKV